MSSKSKWREGPAEFASRRPSDSPSAAPTPSNDPSRRPSTSSDVTSRTSTSSRVSKRASTKGGLQHSATSTLELEQGYDDCLGEALEALSLDYLSTREDLTRRDVLAYIMEKFRKDARGCMSLPVTITFFMLYSCSIVLHEDITNVYLLESAVTNEIRPGLERISTIANVYTWLNNDVVDTFFEQKDLYGDPLPVELWSRVLVYSQVQGSLVLQQVRSTSPWGRTVPEPMDNFTASLVDEDVGFVSIANAKEARRLLVLRPEYFNWFPDIATDDNTYEVYLSTAVPVTEIQATLQYLSQREWIDEDTQELTVKALLLNSELGRPRLAQLVISIYFGQGGNFFYRTDMQSLFLEAWPPNSLCGILDFLWMCMLTGNSFWIFRNLYHASVNQQALKHIMSPWIILEVAITFWGWVNAAGFCIIYLILMPQVRDELVSFNADPSASSANLSDMTDQCVWLSGRYRIFWSWYTLVLMIRFFLAFRAHPRLAVVTRTLRAVGVDLLHFMLVFFPTLGAYVVSGNILFGRRLEDFATLQASAATCIRIVFENEYEWEDLSAEHFFTSAVWVATFLIVVVIIMFNMVLAIILDIYREVRQTVDSADTVFVFLQQLTNQAFRYRNWARAQDINEKFGDLDVATAITKDSLSEMYPDWHLSQVDMLCKLSRSHMAFKLTAQAAVGPLLKMSAAIRQGVDQTRALVDDLRKATHRQNSVEGRKEYPVLLDPNRGSPQVVDNEERPAWLLELDMDLDKQDQWLTVIQEQLHQLQWEWHQDQQNVLLQTRGSEDHQSEQDENEHGKVGKAPTALQRSFSAFTQPGGEVHSRSWWRGKTTNFLQGLNSDGGQARHSPR